MQLLPLVSEVSSSQNIISSNNITGGGIDYDSGPYTVTFTAGMTMTSFHVPINDDDIMEKDEDFTLTIRRGTLPKRVTRVGPSKSTITIMDDDSESFYC